MHRRSIARNADVAGVAQCEHQIWRRRVAVTQDEGAVAIAPIVSTLSPFQSPAIG
jgi:hypothetical protein